MAFLFMEKEVESCCICFKKERKSQLKEGAGCRCTKSERDVSENYKPPTNSPVADLFSHFREKKKQRGGHGSSVEGCGRLHPPGAIDEHAGGDR